jgi:hypothetical protein
MKKRGNDVMGYYGGARPALPSPSSEFLRNRFSH